jgi:orotate phosphoribosyltransferase
MAIQTTSGFSGEYAFDSGKREELRRIIRDLSFSSGTNVTLASGKASTLYFDMKVTMLDPRGTRLMGCAVGEIGEACGAEFLGGLEMGAVPIAISTATMADLARSPLRFFFVRKQVKGHGAKKLIEGLRVGESLSGKRVVVVEDVTTTGGSAIQAVEIIRETGAVVEDVITIVDRQEGARAAFEAIGLRLHSVFEASDFVEG